MRKAIITVAVATALFAVGAFAASFTVQSEDIASGSDDVVACAPYVDIDFDDPAPDATAEWTVSGATARFYTSTGSTAALASACDGFLAELALVTPGIVTSVGSGPISGGTVTFDFAAVPVSAITKASVVVDGKTLTANVPAPTAAG